MHIHIIFILKTLSLGKSVSEQLLPSQSSRYRYGHLSFLSAGWMMDFSYLNKVELRSSRWP